MTAVPATPHKIVFLDRDSLIATVRAPAFAHEWAEYPHTKGSEQTVERLQDATIAISNKVPLRAAELAQLPKLKMIAVAATGTDIIDLAACRERGIIVANIRDYARATVPEHTMALMLALRRQLIAYRADVEAGLWQASERFCLFGHPIRDLAGSRLGLLGYGALGKSVAHLARAFGMEVAVHNRSPINEADVLEVSKEELLATSDILSLHLPLTDKTRNIIGALELASMKPTALLINTARGGLVDEAALAHALQTGVIAGAGFDVLSKEPPPPDNVLLNLRLPNFILTPHTAWASGEAMQKLADQLIANVEAFAKGTPTNVVG
ncbi:MULTISPECIES: D-2-hydroxyacid dehydrogenase [unclassified Janthinobacterium]|uniref:D-2-hydroxyacid dehydrogenase n=1 Tax=unclassified Janthinobacterium TaxID=2610881 RepID=UPI00161B2D4A|nr:MULTISPECIES: D-2-hydroxyacid dehydrogenase [unclassified Janthinobacterium]MBB5368832.1 glycerate dehydrogenase [Janthinobacterium sp. K2C7]MBB5381632.1 glycerate dehydrogenase [Janthinobacterium sp. K2Li3]MBB5387214.1 glycerate dehydrogenase [Janthinobacterium sp. K2E3]